LKTNKSIDLFSFGPTFLISHTNGGAQSNRVQLCQMADDPTWQVTLRNITLPRVSHQKLYTVFNF